MNAPAEHLPRPVAQPVAPPSRIRVAVAADGASREGRRGAPLARDARIVPQKDGVAKKDGVAAEPIRLADVWTDVWTEDYDVGGGFDLDLIPMHGFEDDDDHLLALPTSLAQMMGGQKWSREDSAAGQSGEGGGESTGSVVSLSSQPQPPHVPETVDSAASSSPPSSSLPPPASRNNPHFKPVQEEKWSQRLSELRLFRKAHGHCLVPHLYKPNRQLARWVKRQRRQYKLLNEGKTSTMSAERLRLLEEVGFVWDSHEAGWNERMDELRKYKAQHGHCLVPSTYKANPQLAIWVKCQRRQYKLWRDGRGRTSSMTAERVAELEEVGFRFEVRSSGSKATKSKEERRQSAVPVPCEAPSAAAPREQASGGLPLVVPDDDYRLLFETISQL